MYDKAVDGFRLKQGSNKFCNVSSLKDCYKTKDAILEEIKKVNKNYDEHTTEILYDLYIPNMILPEFKDEIMSARDKFRQSDDTASKNKLNSLIRRNCQEYVNKHVFTEGNKSKLKAMFPQFKKYVDKYGFGLENFAFKNYLHVDLKTTKGAFRNFRRQVFKEYTEKGHIEYGPDSNRKLPFIFNYGNSKFQKGIIDECPLHFMVNVPCDFKFKGDLYKSSVNDKTVLFWHNLEGTIFVNFTNENVLTKFINEGRVFIQLRENMQERDLPEPEPAPEPTVDPLVEMEKGDLKRIHRELYRLTSNELSGLKNKDDLRKYHELRDKYWLKDHDPMDYIINERVQKNIGRMRSFNIGDIGCGHAKLAKRFKELKIQSFDHIKLNEHVTVANMNKLPVKDKTFNYLVYCLAIGWGDKNEIKDYLQEAYRVGKHDCIIDIICTKSEKELVIDHIQSDFYDKIKILEEPNMIMDRFFHIKCLVEKPNIF